MAFVPIDKIQDTYTFNVIIPAIIFTIAVFVLVIFQSFSWVFVICCLYIISTVYGLSALQYISSTVTNLYGKSNTCNSTQKIKDSCGVCSNDTCKRHKLLPHSTKVKVPKDFDHALEQLLEDLLQTYVCAWYSDFSTNESFLQQLRLATATAAKNIAIRLLRADISNIIFYRLIPLSLQHAHDWKILCARAKNISGKPDLRDHVENYFGYGIHPAAYSRKAELNYLRGLVTALVSHLLPAIHISINNKVILREILANWILLPAVDALADPENINALITLCTHRDGTLSNNTNTINVPMLQCWMTVPLVSKITHSQLKPSLDEILNDPRLLYLFMQHVKETGPMNLFQFCLDIDDLSKRMLNPEITTDAEENLYTDIQNMYSIYLDSEGPEYLHLPHHISIGIREILDGGPKKIQELRTSRPFYQAHQEAHALLEATCLPSFHHSYQLYDLLCGQPTLDQVKPVSRLNIISGNTNPSTKATNHFSKIDGVLRTSAIDGAPFQIQDIYQGEEVDCSSRTYSEMKYLEGVCNRDLTTWRVSIPHVDSRGNETLYMIAVHSVAEEKSWTVLRRDQDFYTLRTRLTEFHGDKELNDSPLPSRKNPHPSCAVNRQRYEDFLQKLLSKPVLRSSELLYTFLTTPNLKPYFASYTTPDIGILYQNMAYKLRKEKGQHLDKFMATFLASTNMKYNHTDVGVEISTEPNLNNIEKKGRGDLLSTAFGDNLNLKPELRNFTYSSSKRSHIKGACLCIADAVDRLLNFPPTLSRLVWMFASSLHGKLDPIINMILYNLLAKLLSGGRAAIVVKLLHAKITGDRSRIKDITSQGNSRNYYESAKEGLHSLLPCWLLGFRSPWNKLMDSILDPLQDAPLNKHLAYFLLDDILINLFPELTF